MSSIEGKAQPRPEIRLIDDEADLVADLAVAMEPRSPDIARLLLEEIDRATIVSEEELPADVVRLGSWIDFVDEESGRERTVRLVLPYEADISEGAISVMTHAGAGLLGLSVGQTISWPDTNGGVHRLRVLAVRAAPPKVPPQESGLSSLSA